MASTPAAGDRRAPTGIDADTTLVVRDLHVHYRHGVSQVRRLRSLLRERHAPGRRVHAVRGASLDTRRGEAIGLVGRNGAGKSTLLRAVAGLVPVTSGRVLARSMPVRLGVNAALQPALPARENVMLGGLALGLDRTEVEERTDEIIDFAGLRAAADRPLSTYSNGMRARIHFAIATAVRPEILLVDETLAVGDAAFRRRSRHRLQELIDSAGTVVVVSHELRQVQRLCSRVLWLDGGRIVADGPTGDVLADYRASMADRS